MEIKLSQYNLEVPVGKTIYLYNTLTETSLKLTLEQWTCIKQVVESVKKDDPEKNKWSEVIAFLLENGFILPQRVDEIVLAVEKYNRVISDISRLSLVIAPSLKCNMNCYYCYEGEKPDLSLGVEDIEALLVFIQSRLRKNGKLSITWFGGEPLLSKDFILKVSQKLQDICGEMNILYAFRMVSNGYYLDASTALELSQHGISSVQVTLDGSRHEHNLVRKSTLDGKNAENSFDVILNNILAASEFLNIIIRINVSLKNIDSMPLLIKQLKEAGLAGLAERKSQLYFYPVFNYKPADQSANYLPKQEIHFSMEQFAYLECKLINLALEQGFEILAPVFFKAGYLGCYALVDNGFVIDFRGDIKKCDHELGASGTAFSNLNNLDEFTSDRNLHKWRKRRPESYNSCRACIFLPICYGHCPHSNLTLPDREPLCPNYKYNWHDLFPIFLEKRHG